MIISLDRHVGTGKSWILSAGYCKRRAGFGWRDEVIDIRHGCCDVGRRSGRETRIGTKLSGAVRGVGVMGDVGRTVALDVRSYRRRRVLPNTLIESFDERLGIHLLFYSRFPLGHRTWVITAGLWYTRSGCSGD